MRIFGILISILLVSILFVWWISKLLNRTNHSVNSIQQIENGQDGQIYTGKGPVDYSKEKVKEINELNIDRSKELDQLP